MLTIKSLILSGQMFVLGQVDVFNKLQEVGRSFAKIYKQFPRLAH